MRPVLVTKVEKPAPDSAGPRAMMDRLELDSDQRSSPHFSIRTELGVKLQVSLDRGAEIEDRDVLVSEDGYAVSVVAAEEDLLVIQPGENAQDWAAICYQLGNLHRPLRVVGNEILTPRDAQAEAFLIKLGATFRRESRPFTGRKLGAVARHHHHGHQDGGH